MNKVGKYIIISLLLLLGLCCVGVLYLFFVPNSDLFNITYLNNNITIESTKHEMDKISKIELNSRAYNISVSTTEDETIHAEVFSNSFGFVLTKNESAQVTSEIKNNVLTFNIKEPYGFAVKNNSLIKLYIPSSKSFDLTINNKSAITTIDSSALQINDLSYSTINGSINLKSGSVLKDMKINLNKGIFNVSETFVTSNNDITLKLTTGKLNAEHSVFGDIEILKNTRGVIKVKECVNLNEDISSAGGRIDIDKVFDMHVITSDSNIKVDEINGATITLTGSGNIDLGTTLGVTTLTTNSGNISIDKAESLLVLKTESGNITVDSTKLSTSVSTEYGNIIVNFAEDAESYLDNKNSRVLYARLKNGKLTATGVEHIGSSKLSTTSGIVVSENGRINLKMNNVYGNNYIDGKNGDVKVTVNKESVYVLTTSTTSGSVRVNLTQIPEYRGYTTKDERETKVNCSSSSHNFKVSTNHGDLTVLDTNFAS